jgi:O-antigen/teichoic acid export membrane protein
MPVADTDVAEIKSTEPSVAIDGAADDDLTGRDRLARNVMASWAGHLVFLVAGFVMPHQIDQRIGQVGLGIWDFGWTVVNYFFLAQIGVGVSVNRYVARYRAARDADGLNRMMSSVMLLQLGAAAIVLLLTAATAMWLPALFQAHLGGQSHVATMVIALLGTSIAVRMVTQGFSGVITGCHRWDLHNFLTSGAYAVTVTAMLTALWKGYGLIGISAVYLAGTALGEMVRVVLAFRICPELRVSVKRASRTEARALIAFGAKLSAFDAVKIVVAQMMSLLVLGQIGVLTLAVYSRLCALIRHTENIASKYTLPLTPTASSLQGIGRHDEVRDLLVGSTRITAYLVFPMLLCMAIVGDDVLQIWMGPRYDPTFVLPLMAIGTMFPLSQQALYTILIGLNLHGRFATLHSIGALLSLVGSVVAVRWLHWDLLGFVIVGLVVTNAASVLMAIDTCRRLKIPVRQYFVQAYGGPLTCSIPFAVALLVVSFAFDGHPVQTLAMAAFVGVVVLLPLYWRVAPPEIRAKIVDALTRKIGELRVAMQTGS